MWRVGLEGAHALGLRDDPILRYEGPDDLWLRAALGLMLAWDGRLRLDAELCYGLLRDDWWVSASLGLRVTEGLELSAGVALFEGEPIDVGLGALYDDRDEVWLRAALTF